MNFKKYHVSKNILNNIAESTSRSNVTITVNADKTIALNGTLNESSNHITLCYVDFVEGEKYTISGVTGFTDSTLQIFVDSNSAFPAGNRLQCYNGAVTRTARASERCEVRLYIYNTVTYNNVVVSPQINVGSTPLPYEPYGNTWLDSHYIMGTDTDTLTTLPAVLYPNDTTATVGLKGNMSQTGTPTPSAPIQPQECGERTGNLFDTNFTRYQMGKASNTRISPYSGGAMFYISATPNTNYTIKVHTTDSTFVRLYLSNSPIVERNYISYNVISESETTVNPEVTISNTNYAYLWIQVRGTWYTEHGGSSIMLNSGSTALPYEPYGIKIPISSANTTTPVYLGEVESTRRIKKLVLTGTENWQSLWGVLSLKYQESLANTTPSTITLICDRYAAKSNLLATQGYPSSYRNNSTTFRNSNSTLLIRDDVFGTDTVSFKAYLQQQHTAGTPVTVWYVLATEETGIVNEPIRKIGDYVDTVSSISIPTIAGGDTLSVDTTLQPSEVTVNYKGWHPVLAAHEKSKNLFDYTKTDDIIANKYINQSGNIVEDNEYYISYPIKVNVGETYTWRFNSNSSAAGHTAPTVGFYDSSDNLLSTAQHDITVKYFSFEVPTNCAYIRASVFTRNNVQQEAMLNTGSTALPYEPYWK